MPLGPGGYDSNGIWLYGEDDSEALASDLLNLGMQSVSDALGAGFGKILQVVSTAKTDVFTSGSANTWVDVTGLSASITPSATSSKILIFTDVKISTPANDNTGAFIRLTGGNAGDYVGDLNGSKRRAIGGATQVGNDNTGRIQSQQAGGTYLDSPNTTSLITYQVELNSSNNSGATVNQSKSETNDIYYGRFASSITLMEVAA